jgi:hypothetical protein
VWAGIRGEINERKAGLAEARQRLGIPKVDSTDVAAVLLRQEYRAFLRGLDLAERMRRLLDDPDPTLLAAAFEGPPPLAGLTDETRADVRKAYVERHHAKELAALDERQEALDVVGAAAEIAIMAVRSNVGMAPQEFDQWFETAGAEQTARAA